MDTSSFTPDTWAHLAPQLSRLATLAHQRAGDPYLTEAQRDTWREVAAATRQAAAAADRRDDDGLIAAIEDAVGLLTADG